MLEKMANSPIPLPLNPRIPESQLQPHSPQKYLNDILHLAIWFHDIVYDPIKGAPHFSLSHSALSDVDLCQRSHAA